MQTYMSQPLHFCGDTMKFLKHDGLCYDESKEDAPNSFARLDCEILRASVRELSEYNPHVT
jgi:hypothetical protein